VNGDSINVKWVLVISINPGGLTGGSGTQYFIGDWDGKEFRANDLQTRWIDFGRDNYAGMTFNDAPNSRRIFIGWMNNWEYAKEFPTSPWRGSMTLPRELTLNLDEGKLYLCANPVAELRNCVGEKISAGEGAELLEIKASISTSEGASTKIRVAGDNGKYVEFGYDAQSNSLFVDRSNAWNEIFSSHIHSTQISKSEKILELQAIVESSSVELFAAGGKYVITDLLFLPGSSKQVSFEINEGCQPPRSLSVHSLKPPR
jgi:levanase/fructan beta-fructosidase